MDKHLLILDLDETLIHGSEQSLERACDFQVGPYYLYRRPHLAEFLDTARTHFELAVWSSATEPYVNKVVQNLFSAVHELRFVWSQNRCTQRLHPELIEHYWLKNLNKVKRLGVPLERVLMIDDSPEKLMQHYGNHLLVRPYVGATDDTELRDVLPFLKQLAAVENLRNVEKRHWRSQLK